MIKRLALIIGLGLLAVILSFLWYARVHAPVPTSVVLHAPDSKIVTLAVEIADDDTERAQGLMHRTDLAPGTGMLFTYPTAQPLSFWMKNTLIPLDILFFDEDGAFVSRTTMTPCIADPCDTYESSAPARYALEVNAQETLTRLVTNGWTLELQ